MIRWQIYSDLLVSKRKRRHVLVEENDQVESWHGTLGSAFAHALDKGVVEVTLIDEAGSFRLRFEKVATPSA